MVRMISTVKPQTFSDAVTPFSNSQATTWWSATSLSPEKTEPSQYGR